MADTTVSIPLGGKRGESTIVDAIDADLAAFKWSRQGGKNGYVCRDISPSKNNRKTLWLHRVILERKIGRPIESGEMVDHINHDKLDNRRAALRIASRNQNAQNRRGAACHNATGIRGVTWDKARRRYRVRVQINLRSFCIGWFENASDAENAAISARKRLGVFGS